MPRTVVSIATSFPHPVSAFLIENGYNILEAESAEEAVSFSKLHDIDAVIVAVGGDPGLAELRHRPLVQGLKYLAAFDYSPQFLVAEVYRLPP